MQLHFQYLVAVRCRHSCTSVTVLSCCVQLTLLCHAWTDTQTNINGNVARSSVPKYPT